MSFRKFEGNWIELRRPDCEEVDLHFGERRDRRYGGQFGYIDAMSEVEELVIAKLREAQRAVTPWRRGCPSARVDFCL